MLKPRCVEKEKERKTDWEIDLEKRLPFYACTPAEAFVKSPPPLLKRWASPVDKEQRMKGKWKKEQQNKNSCNCVALPTTSEEALASFNHFVCLLAWAKRYIESHVKSSPTINTYWEYFYLLTSRISAWLLIKIEISCMFHKDADFSASLASNVLLAG